MSRVIFLVIAICTVNTAGQEFVISNRGGLVQGKGKATVTSGENGKATINVNFDLTLDGLSVASSSSTGVTPSALPTDVTPTAKQPGSGVPAAGTPATEQPESNGPPVSASEATVAEEGLKAHNYYRNVHQSPPMILNDDLSTAATAYAKTLAANNNLQHSAKEQRQGQGENLFMACSSSSESKVTDAIKAWYDEVCVPGYTFGSRSSAGGAGHFTQVVWSDSVELGIGVATGRKRGMSCIYVVGRYKPQGNFNTGNDDYNKNVKKGTFRRESYCPAQKKQRFDNPFMEVGPAESSIPQHNGLLSNRKPGHEMIHVIKKAKIHSRRRDNVNH